MAGAFLLTLRKEDALNSEPEQLADDHTLEIHGKKTVIVYCDRVLKIFRNIKFQFFHEIAFFTYPRKNKGDEFISLAVKFIPHCANAISDEVDQSHFTADMNNGENVFVLVKNDNRIAIRVGQNNWKAEVVRDDDCVAGYQAFIRNANAVIVVAVFFVDNKNFSAFGQELSESVGADWPVIFREERQIVLERKVEPPIEHFHPWFMEIAHISINPQRGDHS